MSFEQPRFTSSEKNLASKFQQVRDSIDDAHTLEVIPFDELESELAECGFSLAQTTDVVRTLNTDTLLCRSESFTKALDLLRGAPLTLTNKADRANMCVMASGVGFKTAMEEGFSGKDVGAIVKTVLTFKGDNLTRRDHIPKDNNLWQSKPTTAQVSLRGEGIIHPEDVVMVSFRFPIKYLPESILTPDELDLFEEDKLMFIVRHYVREINTATH